MRNVNYEIKKFDYIDALRGIAVFGVIITHTMLYGLTSNTNLIPSYFKFLVEQGGRGVQLFYIASAFTIFLSYNQRFAADKHPVMYFFIRRFFRIAPLFYIAVLYYYAQYYFFTEHQIYISIANVASNFVFLHGLSPYWINSLVPGGWSISIEMCFYCLIPILFTYIKNINQAVTFLISALIFNILIQIVLNKLNEFYFHTEGLFWNDFLTLNIFNQLPIFALGMIMYYISKNNYQINLSPHLNIIILLAIVILGIQLIFFKNVKFPIHYFFICGVFLMIFALYLSKTNNIIFVNKLFIYLGKISFSLYLVHNAVLFWLERTGFADILNGISSSYAIGNYCLRIIITLFCSLIIATITYHFIEKPSQKMGKAMIKYFDSRFII